jgi:serine/threonine protein kinase
VILFEALTGERPFDAETYNELILKIATEPAPSAFELKPSLSTELIEVIERAMARDPALRIQSIEELALALEPFSGGARFRSGKPADPAMISGDYPSPRIPVLDSTSKAKARSNPARTPARTPQQASVAVEPPRNQSSAVMLGILAATLLLCLGVGALLLRGDAKHDEHVSIAHPAPQPTAAEVKATGVTPAPEHEQLETTVSAVQQGLSAPADLDPSAQRADPPAAKTSRQRPAPALQSKRWLADPPTPEAIPAPAASKRALPKDWDERLTVETPRTVEAPAGHIDAHDFR